MGRVPITTDGSITMKGGYTKPSPTLGVRYVSCHANGVNICALNRGIGAACPSTLSADRISAFNIHHGIMRMANCPARSINRIPNGTTNTSKLQSRRSRSVRLMIPSLLIFQQAAIQRIYCLGKSLRCGQGFLPKYVHRALLQFHVQ